MIKIKNCPLKNFCEKNKQYAPLILRLVVGILFAWHGYNKFAGGIDGVATFFTSLGIPLPGVMAWVVASIELLGGIALILGVATQHFSLLLSIILMVAIVKTKLGTAFGTWNYDVTLLASTISIMLSGAGPYALDSILCKDKKKSKK